jgi:hypothetical protein
MHLVAVQVQDIIWLYRTQKTGYKNTISYDLFNEVSIQTVLHLMSG